MEPAIEFNCPKFCKFAVPSPIDKKRKTGGDLPLSKRRKCSPTFAEKVNRFEHGVGFRVTVPASKNFAKPCLTQPRPFVLRTGERAELKPGNKKAKEEYVPLSVRVSRWLHETPLRCQRETVPCTPRPLERTVPQPFHLRTDDRAVCHKPPVCDPTPPPSFKATELNRKMFETEIGIKKVERKPNTIIKEFNMLRREICRHPLLPSQDPPAPFQFKATAAPTCPPFRPVLPHRHVAASPFHLATEGRPLQRPTARSETESQPAFQFKAQPWSADSFPRPLATRPQKPLTEIQAFAQHSDQRASVRATWDEERRQKERAREEALAQREKERQENEAEELKAFRRNLVHHPLPVGIKKCRAPVSAIPVPASGEPNSTRQGCQPSSPRALVANLLQEMR